MIFIKNKKTDPITEKSILVHRGYPLGNPFPCWPISNLSREEAIEKYKEWFNQQIVDYNPIILNELRNIQIEYFLNHDIELVCFCNPLPCHAQVIKRWIENQKFIRNWFSNMAPIEPFEYQGVKYFSVENFYQAMKVDKKKIEERKLIASMSPYQAKKYSQKIRKSDHFENLKLAIMEYALKIKFNQPFWKQKLQISKSPIVEYNNWGDKFWGVSIYDNCGENHLGKILDKIKLDIC